jgi:hypothetical protein
VGRSVVFRTQPKPSHPCPTFAHVSEGGGFGVGLTVNQLDAPSRPSADLVPADRAWHPARLGELMPVASRNDVELAEEMRRVSIADSRLWAYRVEMIVQLAERRRDDRDRPAGMPGAASPSWSGRAHVPDGVSEFFPDELALILNCSRAEATRLTAVAWTLVHRLPETWAALADGELNWARARAIAGEINRCGSDVDPHVLAAVEAVVLPQAADLPVGRVQALVRAEVVRRDADAASGGGSRQRPPPTCCFAGPRTRGWRRWSPSSRSRWRPRSMARWMLMPARPRPTATRGRSVSSAPRSWPT